MGLHAFANVLKSLEQEAIVFFFWNPIAALKNKYPEQKPVCHNYSEARADIFELCDMVENAQRKINRLKEYRWKWKIGKWTIVIRKD